MKDFVLIPNLAAVILAGGRSRRMGTNKALLILQGQTLIERIANEARHLTDEIWISANESAPYVFLGLPIIPDYYLGQGPLAGLHSGLLHSRKELLLLLACDMPGVRSPLLRTLVQAVEGYDAVVPREEGTGAHAICAVFRRTCLPALEATLLRRNNKVTDLLDDPRLHIRWLTPKEGSFLPEDLRNLNSPKDLDEYGMKTL